MTLGFVFPGQGSQSVGMMSAYADLPVVRDTFEEASQLLGQDLWSLVQNGPADELNLTTNTQPAMLAAGVGVFRAWSAAGGAPPRVMAGHSLGEYSALVAAGAIEFSDAAPLVRFRAQCMQQAVPSGVGAMAAVLGLDDEGVRAACAQATRDGEVAEAANLNAPGQVVIAGHKSAVERAVAVSKAMGAKRAMLLPMSVPSHCSLMKPAAEQLRQRLAAVPLYVPKISVLQNADVTAVTSTEALRQALIRQLVHPVRWVETIRAIAATGATHVVECGPGKVLAGLNKRIAPEVQSLSLSDGAAVHSAIKLSKS